MGSIIIGRVVVQDELLGEKRKICYSSAPLSPAD